MGESRAKKVPFAPQEGQKDGVPRQGELGKVRAVSTQPQCHRPKYRYSFLSNRKHSSPAGNEGSCPFHKKCLSENSIIACWITLRCPLQEQSASPESNLGASTLMASWTLQNESLSSGGGTQRSSRHGSHEHTCSVLPLRPQPEAHPTASPFC